MGNTNFPASLDSETGGSPLGFADAINNLGTTLTVDPGPTGTTLTVVSTSGFPSRGYVAAEGEVISYTGKTSTTFTGCVRGDDSTTAAAHAIGVAVESVPVAAQHNDLVAAIVAIEAKLGIGAGAAAIGKVLAGSAAGASGWVGGLGLIRDSGQLAADVAAVDITSIPSDYAHLLVFVQARSTRAAATDNYSLQFNADVTAGDYVYQSIGGQLTSVFAYTGSGVIDLGTCPGASAAANEFGGCAIFIPNYAGTSAYKVAVALGMEPATPTMNATGGRFKSTAAISRLTLFASAGSLKAGSRVSLYGVGA